MKCLWSLLFITGVVAFADDAPNLLKSFNKMEAWRLEEHEGGKGTIKIDDKAVTITSTKVTGTDWHVQAVMTGLDLSEGKDYVLKFKAKADSLVTVGVNLGIDEEDWHLIGFGEQITVGKTASEHEFRFRAENVNTKKKNRLTFAVGTETCQLTLTDLSLTAK
jgi:hypothetical protein